MSEMPPALLGRSIGGLAGVKLRFRPQLFWQEVLPEHVVMSNHLQFHCDLASGRNLARLPSETEHPPDGSLALSVARVVGDGDAFSDEARQVARALREAAAFQDNALQHLLSSCYCTQAACSEALCEAARQENVAGVELLIRAGADIHAQPQGKTALHIACEEGFEAVARALISADPSLLRGVSRSGHTPLELARERDFGSLARRLEALLV